MTTFRLDRTWRRPGDGRTIVGGSPLRLFRLSPAGAEVADQLERGTAPDTPAGLALADRLVAAGALHPMHDSAPFTVDDVTVVMPFHARDTTAADRVRVPHGLACVLVDDAGPVPPSTAPPGVQVIRRATNGGPAAARNSGLALVDSPLVAFVDDDVVLPDGASDWLEPLLTHFSDPSVALVAPRVASVGGHGRLGRYERRHSPLDLGDEPGRIEPATRLSYVPAAVIVCRTQVVRDLGGFDEGLRYGEDVDLVWRLVGAGHRARYEPTVVVGHRPRGDWREAWRQRVGYGSSAAPLAARHHRALAPVQMNAWSALVWLLVGVRRPVAALAVVAGTVVALRRRLAHLPPAESARLAIVGHLAAGRQVAAAVRRVWWPLALVAALCGPRARRLVATAVLAPPVVDALTAARRDRSIAAAMPSIDETVIALADDVAYGAGVWRGVWRTGEVGALLPRVTSWPRRADG